MKELISKVQIDADDLYGWAVQVRSVAMHRNRRSRRQRKGNFMSPHKGRGLEFAEVRAYHPGDDIRAIDWRVSARKGTTHTRVYQEEREFSVIVVCDLRHHMAFGSKHQLKSVMAGNLASACGWLSVLNNNKTGYIVVTDDDLKVARPASQARIVHRMIREIMESDPGVDGPVKRPPPSVSLDDAFNKVGAITRPGDHIIVISDFMGQVSLQQLGVLSYTRRLSLLHCTDPLDMSLPPPEEYQITDGADRLWFSSEPDDLRGLYEQHFLERCTRLQKAVSMGSYLPVMSEYNRKEVLAVLREALQA